MIRACPPDSLAAIHCYPAARQWDRHSARRDFYQGLLSLDQSVYRWKRIMGRVTM